MKWRIGEKGGTPKAGANERSRSVKAEDGAQVLLLAAAVC